MSQKIDQIRFRFMEELALRDGLYPVAAFILKSAIELSGAKSGVFLYDAPGIRYLEKVATLGLNQKDDAEWSYVEKFSPLPLPTVIRTQKFMDVGSEGAVKLLAYPLRDLDLACAGFALSFDPAKAIDEEMRELLFWIAKQAEQAIFRSDGEGV